jgi:hypothetical protein
LFHNQVIAYRPYSPLKRLVIGEAWVIVYPGRLIGVVGRYMLNPFLVFKRGRYTCRTGSAGKPEHRKIPMYYGFSGFITGVFRGIAG